MNKLFKEKKDCAGCSACMNICPKGAIEMKEDEYGFIYPFIDEEKCIHCNLCKKVCSYQNDEVDNIAKKVYAAITKEEFIINNSASGGIFGALAKTFLEKKGIVYGCSMEIDDDVITPKHIRISNLDDLIKLQGSKYAKSIIDFIYKDVKNDLNDKKKVLFSGTPCQIAALKSYLNISKTNIDNLYTIDIICHGTPSTKMFQDYIKFYESKHKVKIIDLKFRNKNLGWGYDGRISYIDSKKSNCTKVFYSNLSSYYNNFLNGNVYRENCYSCKYACQNRVGDITIGDYWGIENEHPEYVEQVDIKKGISCIIVNNIQGEKLINKYGLNIFKLESNINKVAKTNKQLNEPSKMPKIRKRILNEYKDYGYVGVEKEFRKRKGIKLPLSYIKNKLK